MFFLLKVYLKKDGFPFKTSTELKEMQISYSLFQAQQCSKIHTQCWSWFSPHSVKAVVPTGQSGDKKRGSWHCVSQLQFVLWEYLTQFPEIGALGSELWRLDWS